MEELVKEIRRLRNREGIPLHFRRRLGGSKPAITISYGYKRIAHNVSEKEGLLIVNAVRWVYHDFVNP